MNDDSMPGELRLSAGLGPLVACPLCGADKGYLLAEGSTYRWWLTQCKHCGETVAECASDRRTQLGTVLPDRWPEADQAWNANGAYADRLRRFLMAARDQFREYGHDGSAAACDAALRA